MQTPGERLRLARTSAGFDTIAEAARSKRFHRQNLADHEAGRRRIGPDQALLYAKAFQVDARWILFGHENVEDDSVSSKGRFEREGPELRLVQIVGEVRAGAWTEVTEEVRVEGEVPVFLPSFARAFLYALRVVGRSMDQFYPDDSVVIVCPAAEAGVRENDHVVVRRLRGGLVETTIKEVVREGGEIVLYPRSTDRAFQEPIRLATTPDADEGPEIIGVVVASFVARGPRSGPLLRA